MVEIKIKIRTTDFEVQKKVVSVRVQKRVAKLEKILLLEIKIPLARPKAPIGVLFLLTNAIKKGF